MSGAELQRIDSFQYPNAHLGHLTEGQQKSLDSFKQLCASKGYYKPASVGAAASHDDETLLRYLRARKFIPQDAFGQFKDTEDWRKENELEKLYDSIDINDYDQTRRLYPQWTGRRDKRGIPVYVFEVAHLDLKKVKAYAQSTSHNQKSQKIPEKMLRLFALYENMMRFILPLCSAVTDRPHPETPVSQSNNIVDISKVGLKQFWDLKNHMQDASTLATAHYPETLDRIFIIGAPSFFPTVWSWIKRWFDPITVSKIFILSNQDMKSTLEKYIDPANIPKKYGGQLDYAFGDMPIIEPAIERTLQWEHPASGKGGRTIPTGPIKWEDVGGGKICAVAVGSENGKPRRQVIAALPSKAAAAALRGDNQSQTLNIPLPDNELTRTTSGEHTHPKDTGIMEQANGAPISAAAAVGVGQATHGINDLRVSDPNIRTGTSESRYMQQDGTHAAGEQGQFTPAVNDHGHGDKTQSYEPGTVGQAPKEAYTAPPDPADFKDTSYVGQAKEAATTAVNTASQAAETAKQTVLGAVGMTGEKDESKAEHAHVTKEDPAVDNADKIKIEEMIRSGTMDTSAVSVDKSA